MSAGRWLRRLRKWLHRRANPWRVTRWAQRWFACERWSRITGEFQHRHLTDRDPEWKPGRNPYRRNAYKWRSA